MRFLSGVLALTWMAGALSAQIPSVAEQEAQRARQLLSSSQWVDRAWGVYLSAALRGPNLNDVLVEQFRIAEPLRNATSTTEEYFVTVLFDAAIGSGAVIPASLLEPFLEHWTVPALILLARDQDTEDALLRLAASESPRLIWLGANNLLYERKSRAWYAAMLAQVRVTHHFVVTDQNFGSGFGCGGSGVMGGSVPVTAPKGFPPVGVYSLTDVASSARDVRLATGPMTVYYRRTVVPTDCQVDIESPGFSIDPLTVRFEYLDQLAHRPQGSAQSAFQRQTTIPFTNAQTFTLGANRQMEAQERSVQEITRDIERHGLEAPEVEWTVIPEIDDSRSNQSVPLPTISPGIIRVN